MQRNEDDRLPGLLGELQQKGDGYVPPGEDYFSVMAARSFTEATAPARNRRLPLRWLAAAASVLLLVVTAWWISPAAGETELADARPDPPPTSEELLGDLDPALIDDYVVEEIDAFTTELYAESPLQDYR